MSAENKPQSLENFSPRLYNHFGSTNPLDRLTELTEEITEFRIVVSPTGTGIVLNPNTHRQISVRPGCWWLTLKPFEAKKEGGVK